MAAAAYLLLPVSGGVAFLFGKTARVRFHGLQAIVFGTLWPALLFALSAISPGPAQAGFAIGGAIWMTLVVGTAMGQDLRLPWVADRLWAVAADPVRSGPPPPRG